MAGQKQGEYIQKTGRSPRSPFTLVELCVTIVVVLVIWSLLSPVMRKAFADAKSVSCLGNMHHLGIAFMLYGEKTDGLLPHEDFGSEEPPSGQCWYTELDPLLGISPPHLAKQDPDHVGLHSEAVEKLGFSYKMNSRLEDYKGDKDVPSPPFCRVSTIPDLARTVLLFDGRCDKAAYKRLPFGIYTSVEARHQDRASILFADSHCKLVPAECDARKHWTGPGDFFWDPYSPLEGQ